MCDPSTVTLIADVAPTLLDTALLDSGALCVIAIVNVFSCQPVVMAVRLEVHDAVPAVDLILITLSECHAVTPFEVLPSRDGEL